MSVWFSGEWLEDSEVNTLALLSKSCEPDEVLKHVHTYEYLKSTETEIFTSTLRSK